MGTSNFQCFLVASEIELKLVLDEFGLKNLEHNNPDLSRIIPEKKIIKIDQIRELKKHIFQKPIKIQKKVVVIEDAHNLNLEAQNSLLKLLEEPPPHAIIFLKTRFKFKILPTILSRVLIIPSSKPSLEKITDNQPNINSLMEIPNIENAEQFLDQQIVIYSIELNKLIKEGNINEAKNIGSSIEKYKEAKRMVDANINKTFVLGYLFLK